MILPVRFLSNFHSSIQRQTYNIITFCILKSNVRKKGHVLLYYIGERTSFMRTGKEVEWTQVNFASYSLKNYPLSERTLYNAGEQCPFESTNLSLEMSLGFILLMFI